MGEGGRRVKISITLRPETLVKLESYRTRQRLWSRSMAASALIEKCLEEEAPEEGEDDEHDPAAAGG